MRKIATCLLLAGLCAPAVSSALAGAPHQIVQSERAFHPGEVTVGVDEVLSFSNRDEFIHQIYVKSDSMNFDSDEQAPGQIVQLSFPARGTFEVRCHIHPKMSLFVHVQ